MEREISEINLQHFLPQYMKVINNFDNMMAWRVFFLLFAATTLSFFSLSLLLYALLNNSVVVCSAMTGRNYLSLLIVCVFDDEALSLAGILTSEIILTTSQICHENDM